LILVAREAKAPRVQEVEEAIRQEDERTVPKRSYKRKYLRYETPERRAYRLAKQKIYNRAYAARQKAKGTGTPLPAGSESMRVTPA